MASHQRPYEFGRLITSTIAGRESDAHYENGLSQAIAKRFGSPAWAGIGYCLPPRSAARDLLTTPASAAGDLIGESIAAVAQSLRPVTVLEQAGLLLRRYGGAVPVPQDFVSDSSLEKVSKRKLAIAKAAART